MKTVFATLTNTRNGLKTRLRLRPSSTCTERAEKAAYTRILALPHFYGVQSDTTCTVINSAGICVGYALEKT